MHPSILHNEIHEQPHVIRTFLDQESTQIQGIAKELKNRFSYVVIAARGSSDNAARYAQYLLGVRNHLQVALATPSVFSLYDSSPDLAGALVIGISQSGKSPDITCVLETARRQNVPTLVLTNDPSSPLAKSSEYVVPLHAGQEKAVAATKTYTTSLTALAMLSCYLGDDEGQLALLNQIPEWMEQTITLTQKKVDRTERYRFIEHCAIIGRGFNYSTAFEISLKIKELNRIVAEPYSSADFRHGPIATIRHGFPVFIISPKGPTHPDLSELIRHLHQLNAEMMIVSDNASDMEYAQIAFPIPVDIPEWLTPLVAVIPGQMFALRLALEKRLDPDSPEGLTKITETL